MLANIINVFETILEKEGDTLITKDYVPTDGNYRIITMNPNDWKLEKPISIRFNKKNSTITCSNEQLLPLIQKVDYYSKLIASDSYIDLSKIILSNNYLSLSVKNTDIRSGKLTKEVIKKYYETLRDPYLNLNDKYTNGPDNFETLFHLYNTTKEKIGAINVDLIDKIEQFVLSHNIWDGMDIDDDTYSKIFFVFPNTTDTLNLYRMENNRYLMPNIFLDNNYNQIINGTVWGVPRNNIEIKYDNPYIVDVDSAILRSKFFDFLFCHVLKNKVHFYFDSHNYKISCYSHDQHPENFESGWYLRCKCLEYENTVDSEAKICDTDIITKFSNNLSSPFHITHYLTTEHESEDEIKTELPYNNAILNKWEIFNLLNSNICKTDLSTILFYYPEPYDIRIPLLKNGIVDLQQLLISCFWKGQDIQITPAINNYLLNAVKSSILKDNIDHAKVIMNLKLSLWDHFNDQTTGLYLYKIQKQLHKHFYTNPDTSWDFSSDDEYSYAVGQFFGFFFSRIYELFNFDLKFDTKDVYTVKNRVHSACQKTLAYDSDMLTEDNQVQFINKIFDYNPKKINEELLICGYISPTILVQEKRCYNPKHLPFLNSCK